MSKFRNWYVRNQDTITWTIIGCLTIALVNNIVKHNWAWALLDAVLIYINYKFRNFRMK